MGTLNRDPECFLHHESRVNSAQCTNSLRKEKQTKAFEKEVNKNNQNKDYYNPLNQKAHSRSQRLAYAGPQESCPPSLWDVPQLKIPEKWPGWFKLSRTMLPLCFLPPTLDSFLIHQAGSAQTKQNGQWLQIYIEQMRNQRKNFFKRKDG